MSEVQPLSLSVLEQLELVPSSIIAVLNQLIKQNWNGESSTFRVDEALGILKLIYRYSEEAILRNKWIEVAVDSFVKSGYSVDSYTIQNSWFLKFEKAQKA